MNKQHEIAKYLKTVESATTQEILKAVPFGYYCNGTKHIGDILNRMVKSNKIIRIKKGVFKLATIEDLRAIYADNQINLELFAI